MSRSFIIDDTCVFAVNSHTPTTGAAVDADTDPGYRIYEDETGTPILTGTMAKLDDANTTGFYSESITLSAANGFEYGKSYCIRKTVVVGGVTGVDLEYIQMGARVDTRLLVGDAQSATDLKDFADAGYDPATNKVEGVKLADTLTTYTGNTPQTGDNFAIVNGASGLVAIKGQTAAIETDTQDIQGRLPAALTGGKMESNLGSITAGIIAAASFAVGAFDAVWTVAARTLTSAVNITSTGGTTVPQTGDAYAVVNSGTFGNSALKTLIDAIGLDVDAILVDTDTTIPGLIAALNNLSAAQVNAEIVDCLNVDTYAQPGQGTPAATTTITLMLRYLYKGWRNRSTQTASEYNLFNDDAATVDQKSAFTDDGVTATRGEVATGP